MDIAVTTGSSSIMIIVGNLSFVSATVKHRAVWQPFRGEMNYNRNNVREKGSRVRSIRCLLEQWSSVLNMA